MKVSELKGKAAQQVTFIYCNCQTNWLASKELSGPKNAANRRKYIKEHGDHDLVSYTQNRRSVAKPNCMKIPPKYCPECKFAEFPNAESPFDFGVPRCTLPGSFDSIYHPITERQPSQEPEDDGEKLGPCNDVVCQDAIVSGGLSCNSCSDNPMSEENDDEDDSGD